MLALRPQLREEIADDQITVLPSLGRTVRAGADIRSFSELRRAIQRFEPHVVHTHMAKAGTLGRLAASFSRVPIVVHTFHGTVFAGHFNPVIGRTIAEWERLLARRTDATIAVSHAVAEDLARRHISAGRIRVVPLGMDLGMFAAVPPLEDSVPVVTLVARLAAVKDVPLFIRAAGHARERIPGLEVRVVGDGPLRSKLTDTSPPWVRWLGNIGDLAPVYASSGAIALSSRSEGSPVTLIEALAAARPVAGVPVKGVTELLVGRPGAVLATERSPRALAGAIEAALTDPSVAAGAAGGRASIVEEFAVDRLITTMESIYDDLWDSYRRGDGRRR